MKKIIGKTIDNRKILINYTAKRGGGAVEAVEMASELINLGVSVSAVISDGVENIEEWKQIRFDKLVIIKTYGTKMELLVNSLAFGFNQKNQILHSLNRDEFDWVYCPMISLWCIPINRIFKKAKVAFVLHDPIPHSGTSRMLSIYNGLAARTSDIIIVHTRKFVEVAKKLYKRPAFYIPMGRFDQYKRCKNKKQIVKYDEDKINFVFFGVISEYKGLDILAAAFKKLSKRNGDKIHLYIIGGGAFSRYKDYYKDLDNVTVINRWIKDGEVENIFNNDSIVTVCPYKDATQSGVVPLSFEYNVPVIASDCGGLSEQVADGKTGLLTEPGDARSLFMAMKRICEDPELVNEMKANISSSINKNSWKKFAKRLIKIIDYMDEIDERKHGYICNNS